MADNTNKINAELLLQELQGGGANDSLNIKELFYLCLAKWKWFVLSVGIAMGIAVLYILCTPPVYTRSAYLMVKEDTKGKAIGSDVASMFADLGLTQANANVNNELLAMQVPSVMREVVKRLSLDWNYRTDGLFHKEVLYGQECPVKISVEGLPDNESVSFSLKLMPGGKLELEDFNSSERDVEDETVAGVIGNTLSTPIGKMRVAKAESYLPQEEYPLIHVTRSNLYDCADACAERLKAELSSEDATVIELSYEDVSIPRAEDVLNTVIAVYNEEWIRDKNQVTVSTSQFITDRLHVLEHELGDVDADISTYKSTNLLPDADKASALYMEQAQETNNQILALNTRISMARYIRNHLTGTGNRNQLLPVNSGLENPGIENQIAEYNSEQLRRNNLVTNSSEQNPLIIDIDQSLAAMRKSIVSSIDNLIVSLGTQRDELMRNERSTTEKIAANPNQTKYLQSVGRQ
ncbi:MAG: chromosome partitioning protein ParA, partial [Bacteroidales bacterium]|nr:chromosome partitioning protein ParA [Bacteroidales bacterium]